VTRGTDLDTSAKYEPGVAVVAEPEDAFEAVDLEVADLK
jgi:hypothetical protein